MPLAVRKIASNTVALIIGKVIATLLTLYALRLLIGYTSEEVYANYATAITFLSFFSVLADMGLYMVFMQEISAPGSYASKRKTLGSILTLRMLTAIGLFALAPVIAYLFFANYSDQTKTLILIGALAFIPLAINQVYVALFQKELDTKKTVIAEIVGRSIFVITIVLVMTLSGSLVHVVIGLIIGNLFHFGLTWFFSRKYAIIPFVWDIDRLKSIMIRAWPLAVAIILNLIYFKIDALMLSRMKGEYEVGVYSIAYKVLEVTTIIPALILGLILPYLAKYAKTNKREFKTTFEKTLIVIMTLAFPMVIGGIILAQPIINLLAEGKFPDSVLVLQILLIAGGIIFFGNLFNHGMIAIEKQRTITWVYALGAGISILTNLIFIPFFSYTGAAISTIFVEFLVMVLVGWSLSKHRPWKWPLLHTGKVIFASLAMGGVLWYVQSLPFPIAFTIGIGTYLLVLALVQGIPMSFIRTLRGNRSQ